MGSAWLVRGGWFGMVGSARGEGREGRRIDSIRGKCSITINE